MKLENIKHDLTLPAVKGLNVAALTAATISKVRFAIRYPSGGLYRSARKIGRWNICTGFVPLIRMSPIRGIT